MNVAWSIPLLAIALMAETAPAQILEPCIASRTDTIPAHPGPQERIGLHTPTALLVPQAYPVVAAASVMNGLVDVDIVMTDDPDAFAGYRRVGDVVLNAAAYIGPMAPGVYPIHTRIRQVVAGVETPLCTLLPARLEVGTAPLPVALVDAVEFFNPARNRYFLTADAGEQAYLDSGGEAGWTRTGQHFAAYLPGMSDNRGRNVCRFVSPPGVGIDAHFLSVSLWECFTVSVDPAWREEGDAFDIGVPDVLTGECAGGLFPVYRLWNPRTGDHRWIADAGLAAALAAQGWVREGYGDAGVAMCAPAA